MEFEKFTERSRSFIQAAQNLVLRCNHQRLTPEHILKVLLDDYEGLVRRLIVAVGGDPEKVLEAVDRELALIPNIEGSSAGQIYLTPETVRLFEKAEQTAEKAGDSYVTAECILLALALSNGTPSAQILDAAHVDSNLLERAILNIRKGRKADSATADTNFDALNKYAIDVTSQAQDGVLDPVIGRDEEVRRAIQVLARRTKNNPVLIGDPGVGKTAIVEGLAQRIVKGDVPECLIKKRLMMLDLGALIAGAKFRCEFEERLRSVLQEVNACEGKIVLFIDELHTLVGAGASDGAMDASNMLKPALARGELRCIGATTLDEYRNHVEKDAALARRFQPVFVAEPSLEETISILRGLKEKYEIHHGVRITDSAIMSAVNLSNRYVTDRFLPDKAIDLVDEAASRLRMQIDSKPEEIFELDCQITQLKIEREALRKETDKASQDRLKKLEVELADLDQKNSHLTAIWQLEKEKIDGSHRMKEELDVARSELEVVQREGDLTRAGELMYSVIPELEHKMSDSEATERTHMLQEEVMEADIAAIVSHWTGIPVEKLLEGQCDKLLKMEATIGERVIGQEEAVAAVSDAVRRARTGLQDPKRPIGSFMFLGPTGVGKTELTKALAEFLFDDDAAMIRIDMSEYMEKHSVARLIGAPPGYVGYEDGGILTELVRRRPYQVILFEEIEKAHPDVFNVLLQVLDDGRLTDGHGRTVDFRNTLIILTSNLGSDILAGELDAHLSVGTREQVFAVVRAAFRPEFLNRLDDMLLFQRLKRSHIDEIVDIQIARLHEILADRKITLTLDPSAREWIAAAGFDPVYGARPLKRVVQKSLQNPLASKLLEGAIGDGDLVNVSAREDSLLISAVRAEAA